MYWLEVSVRSDGEGAEAISELLLPFAFDDSVVLEQLGDSSSPDPCALEPEVCVKIYVPGDEDVPALRRRIEEALYHMGRLYPMPSPQFRKLEEEDWANAWKSNYRPFLVGQRLWIQPSWQAAEEPKGEKIIITLDPGMAFGTGLHPSTQMCLQLLEELAQPGLQVLDIGTGSGILAIAALKLGALRTTAFDTDRKAAETAAENANRNSVGDRLDVFQGPLAALKPEPWDLVVVNILAPVIEALLTQNDLLAYVAPEGRLILSGIVEDQEHETVKVLHKFGASVERKVTVRDWVTLVAKTKNAMT